MINFTKGGELALRKVGGVLSFHYISIWLDLSFAAFLLILGFCGFLFVNDLLSFSLVLGHSIVLHLILNPKFKLCAFGVVNVLIKVEIEKPSGLCLGIFV
jgi:hypothetical protein